MKAIDARAADLFNELADEFLAYWRQCMWEHVEGAAGECESPIEQRMLMGLVFMELPFFFGGDAEPYARLKLSKGKNALEDLSYISDDEFCILLRQAKALTYRLDFCLLVKFEGRSEVHRIVVECDGHDFHERTKEQARRDRKRDRDLQMAGMKVFRFTGSEIFRDVRKCVSEIQTYLKDLEHRTRDY